MRLGEVIGRLTLSRQHANLPAGRLLIVRPLTRAAVVERAPTRGEDLVVFDQSLGAGVGSIIGVSEGREAANPFGKTRVPIDAYCACLIDSIS
jgi:ethanolamine utilization protein EutN